jgi:hypothetical protein
MLFGSTVSTKEFSFYALTAIEPRVNAWLLLVGRQVPNRITKAFIRRSAGRDERGRSYGSAHERRSDLAQLPFSNLVEIPLSAPSPASSATANSASTLRLECAVPRQQPSGGGATTPGVERHSPGTVIAWSAPRPFSTAR